MTAHPEPRAPAHPRPASGADAVRRARSGSRDAFEQLAVEAMPSLLGTATRLLGGGYAAEEAVAEALFRAWTHLATFRGEAAFSTWLHRILCRVAADRYRRDRRDRRRRDLLAERVGRPASGPSRRSVDRLARREERERLRAAIDRLPARQRLVLVLHAWEGLDLRETARVLGIRYATAKSNLCHARKAVRALLGEEDA